MEMDSLRSIGPGSAQKAVLKCQNFIASYRYNLRQRNRVFQIPDRPMLDEASMPVYCRMLAECELYLEYGSGGSTVYAASLNKPFISVDTNRYFLKAVEKKIGRLGPLQLLKHANVGWIGTYGYPAFQKPRFWRVGKWSAYAEFPWRFVERDRLPDLVLVDGRFRVAAGLTSFLHLAEAPHSRVLVDDYTERPFYHELESYARLVEVAGRMAIFQPLPEKAPAIGKALLRYSKDWR